MANHMETYITIKNGDIKVAEKLKEIFTPKEGEYQVDTEDLVKRIFGEYSPEEYDRGWYIDNIGAKWIYSEFEYDDNCEYIHLHTTSAWSVPQGLLERLAKVLSEVKEDCYIIGTYEDESYDPCGAFVYAGDYDDIEDWDGEIDYDKMWEDDEYRDELYENFNELRDELESCYLEYLTDKEENPEDYE